MDCPNKTSAYLSTSGYASELGLGQFSYDAFQAVYGKSASIERWFDEENPGRELELHQYASFDVLYLVGTSAAGDEYLTFLQIMVKDDNLRFGKLKIGIGSRRLAVQIAYLFEEKLSKKEVKYESHDYPEVDGGYYGENWWRVLFSYDASGEVDSFAYTISPN